MKKFTWIFCCLALASPAAHAQKLTWSRIWGSTNSDAVTDIARDSAGYLYVCGYAPMAFDGQTNSGGQDAFVTKFDTNGVKLWTRIWGSSADDSASGVCIDRQTNVYVCGQTAGAFHDETKGGALDFFLTKWTQDGTLIWTRIWGATNDDNAAGVVVDQANDVYVGGQTLGNFGTAGQTNAKVGGWDFCLTKRSSDGSFQWSRIWGCTNSDWCYDVAIDPYDTALYLCGYTRNGVFEGQTNFYAYDRLALTAINTAGTRLWSSVWGATNKHNYARSVSAYGMIYVVGWTFGNFDGESNHVNAFNNGDYFITQFDGSAKQWTRIWGTSSWEEAHSVAVDAYDNAYLTGETGAPILDGQTSSGGSDFLMVKYDASGNRQWTRLWGGPADDGFASGIALDGTNGLYVCGDSDESFGGQTNPGSDSAVLTRWRQGPNVVPSASIARPTAGYEFLQNESALCIGSGNDTDDGPLTNLVWQFGTNISFGYGQTCTVSSTTSPGSQTVTVYAIDTEFATGKATMVVTVLQNSGGVPENWQTNYWPNGDSGGSTNDFDQDGLDNQSEWVGGSDPTNPLSVFKCSDARGVPGSPQVVLLWSSISNRDYAISSSSNLPAGFSPLATVPATPPLNTYTTPASVDPQLYYRVEVGR